jgi:hypothetical protein
MEARHPEAQLPEVVLAFHAVGGLAYFLHGGDQQADEDGDDGDHHQQLDQRERPPGIGRRTDHGRSPELEPDKGIHKQ